MAIIFLCIKDNKDNSPQKSTNYIIYKDKETPKDRSEKYGIIYQGQGKVEYLLKPIYDTIDKLDDNYFRIQLNNEFGLVYRGTILLTPAYDSVRYFNQFLISFYPHILFRKIKIFYYWILFYLGILSIILSLILFFRYGDLSNLFFISNFRKVVLRVYNMILRTVPLSLCIVLFLPWAFFLEYSLWINTTIVFAILVFMDLLIRNLFEKYFNYLRENHWDPFHRPGEDLFTKKGLLFRSIQYNNDGEKKYFLVRNLQGKWVIIDKRLRLYGDYKFDEFLGEKEGVFSMRKAKDECYVYIAGQRPRVNRRLTY